MHIPVSEDQGFGWGVLSGAVFLRVHKAAINVPLALFWPGGLTGEECAYKFTRVAGRKKTES